MTMMDMSGHDQAAMTHEMMQNGNASAHQDMAEMHKKMMKSSQQLLTKQQNHFPK